MRLYHATPNKLDCSTLIPATKNIALAIAPGGQLCAEAIPYDDANTPYVYASSDEQVALTYAVTKGVRLGNCHGPNGTQLLFLDKESVIGEPQLHGGLYTFASEEFLQIHSNGVGLDQWVSANPVDLGQANFLPITAIDDILTGGVQGFQLSEKMDAWKFYQVGQRIAQDDHDGSKWLDNLGQLVKSGHLRWLNQERGINAARCLPTDGLPATDYGPQPHQTRPFSTPQP